MSVTVLDTATATRAILTAAPADRADGVRAMLAPARGMYRYLPSDLDLAQAHRMGSGFPLDRDTDVCLEALDTLEQADAWNRVARALDAGLVLQTSATPEITVPDLTVALVLGDPGDEYFRSTVLGATGNGSVTGYLLITLWPTRENLDRLEATAVHELNHNLRYAPGGVVWDPATVQVGEQIVIEGLADAFARQMYGDDLGYTRIGVPHLKDDAVFAKVLTGLRVTGMRSFTAWVHGDAAAARFGVPGVGLPTGAGYAAGNRILDSYLTRTGSSAADVLHVPSAEIIETALADN